jgi:hypothetical protein
MKTTSSRYDGKPLLRLVELYVLWVVDELPPSETQILSEIAPKLHAIFGGDGTWQAAIAEAMKFPPSTQSLISELWQRHVGAMAASSSGPPDPQAFAEAFVDENVPI